MYFLHLTLLGVADIADVGHGGNDVHVELTVKAFLHNLHVKQTEEATAEAKAESHTGLGREGQRGIIQLQLLKRGTQVLILRRVNGVDTRKDHRLHFLETLNGCRAGAGHMGDGVAHLHLLRILNATDDIAHVARPQFLTGYHVHLQHANLVGIILHTRIEELHQVAFADASVHYFEIGNDASERVEHRVKNQRLQRSIGVAYGMGDTVDNSIEYLPYPFARLSAGTYDFGRVATNEVNYLVLHFVGHGRGHVNFVDNGNYLQVMVNSHIEVRDSLRLHPLRGIYHQQCTFAGSYTAAHLIREVHMSRRINQIQDILLTTTHILHLYGVTLDGNTALTLQFHIVKHLALSHLNSVCSLKQPVGQRRLTVVNMCNNAEVPYVIHINNLCK